MWSGKWSPYICHPRAAVYFVQATVSCVDFVVRLTTILENLEMSRKLQLSGKYPEIGFL